MWENVKDLFTVLTPIIVALIGLQGIRAEKETKKLVDAQKELNDAKDELKRKDEAEKNQQFTKLDQSIQALAVKVEQMDKTVEGLTKLDSQLKNLMTLSTATYEFTSSLSSVVQSIGNALENSDSINSGSLKEDLANHKKMEASIRSQVVKILY